MTTKSKATQDFVPIKEVRDGIVVLKNNGMRAVVMASSLNFALKSEDERNSIIYQFQNFLNSLDFPIQIFIQSRKLDIRPYVALLEERYKDQLNDLMKIQIKEYISFVKNFTENSSIMTKSFFIVVPYDPPIVSSGTQLLSGFLSGGKKSANSKERASNFEEYRMQLDQRVSVVEQGLVRAGIRTVGLGTEEVVELFYKIFNPGDTEKPIQIN